jgi:nitroreductase
MELADVVRSRRMVRSFRDEPIGADLVDRLLDDALRAPTAGNARGTAWLALQGPAETGPYWEATTTPAWRAASRRWPGLSRAPVVALSLASPPMYVERYSEPDKAGSGLGTVTSGGGGDTAWPVPYWFADAAFSAMTLLLAAVDAGLGACFLGNFRGEAQLLDSVGVPEGWRLFGSVLLGQPDDGDHRSASLDRATLPRQLAVHRGRWSSA